MDNSIRRLIVLASLVIAISFIILDNHFIYEEMIQSQPYFKLRTTVRSIKSHIGLKYKFTEYHESSKKEWENNLNSEKKRTDVGYEIKSTYYDGLEKIIGQNRLKKMKRYHDTYRNSSRFANEAILGDLIYEYLNDRIDTLNVPIERATTRLFWFIYPVILNANPNYKFELDRVQYESIGGSVVTIEGSRENLINIYALGSNDHKENYYLFGWENELFIFPKSVLPEEWLNIN